MRLRHRCVTFAVVIAGLLPRTAHTQSREGFAIERFEPADRGGGWFVVDALDVRGHMRPAFGAAFDYAHLPLVGYDASQSMQRAIVRHRAVAHASAALVIGERFRVALDVPVAIYQDGEPAVVRGVTLAPATSPAFGDVRWGGDARLFGEHDGALRLAIGARAWIPTGTRSQFTSDGAIRVGPHVLAAGDIGPLAWAVRIAFVYRAHDQAYAGTPLGSEIAGGAGLGVRVGRVLLGPEVFAGTRTDGDAFLRSHGTPIDFLVGAHYRDPSGFEAALGAGAGLSRGFGAPASRMVVSLGWGAPIVPPPREEEVIVPEPEHMPDEDTDRDSVDDRDDACPTAPGVRTRDPMTNGCPPETPRALAVATTTEIRIGEEIRFATDSAELVESEAVLEAVRVVLDAHPDIRRVRVEGHTDDTGSPAHNEELSRRRAEAVVSWLVQHGIEAKRLVAEGFGSRRPLVQDGSEEARRKNRRVTFTILER